MKTLEKFVVMQVAYIFYSCIAISVMINSPFYSADARLLGSLLFNFVLVVWSCYMFITGIVLIANNAKSKQGSRSRDRMRGVLRITTVILFAVIAQWVFARAFLVGMN